VARLSPVLDHVVVDVCDRVADAMRCYQSLGFQLSPRGRHTLGSVNHLAMFATDYLELLGFAPDGAVRPEIMSFPVGFNGLVFKAADADLVHREAAEAGLPILPVQSFSRPVTLDGETHDARFRTTRLDPGKVAMGRVYFCEHQTPDLVWRREWQVHPNGAKAITRVVIVATDPQSAAQLFRSLFGDDAVTGHDGRQIMSAGVAQIELVTPALAKVEFDNAAADPARRTEYMAALEVRVASLSNALQLLRSVSGLRVEADRLVVPAVAAFNVTLIFVE